MLKRLAAPAALVLVLAMLLVPALASAQTASSTSSLIVKLVAGLSPEQQAQVIARNGGVETSSVPALRLHVVEVLASELADVLARYQADPDVVSAEENKRRQWEMAPSDALYGSQWALPKIAWDLVYDTVSPTGSATVALLDSGIDAAHPDLGDKVVAGTSILDGSNGLSDPSGHGTALAGIIAAQTGGAEGIAGVAFAGVRVMPVTVLNANGEGWDSDVIAGVVWAADHGADVILMAFSNPGFSQNLQDAIDYAWSKGVVLVAAVGNNGENAPTFPAGHRGVVGVSATDSADGLASFSNSGTATFLAAPGVDIQTTWIGDSYTVASGTSTSAAIVAGVAAFMKATDPTLTNGIIVGRMARMADPAGTQEQTGNGRINMARALVDTSTEEIQPSGADPVGNGGPFVGPYLAAALNVQDPSVGTQTGTLTVGTGGSVTYTVTIPVTGSGSSITVTPTVSGLPAGVTSSFNPPSLTFSANGSQNTTLTVTTQNTTPAGTTTFTLTSATGKSANGTLAIKANTTTTITADTPDPSSVGQPYTVSYSVAVIAPGTGTPTGNVTVSDGTDSCTGTVAAGGCSLTSTTAGAKALTASYAGNATFHGSTSTTAAHTVNRVGTTTSVASSLNPSDFGQQVTFTASISGQIGSTRPTGNVTFKDGATVLGTASTQGNSGMAAFSTSALSIGAHSITAEYGGNASFGSSASAVLSQMVNGDTTPPVITPDVSGTPGSNGWYTSDVTVSWTVTDPESTVTSQTGCGPTTISSDTGGTTLTCSATSAGGTASQSVTVKRDGTSPTISGSRAPAANAHGWNNADVTVTFTCNDSLSGVASCGPTPQTLSSEGAGQSASGTAQDSAGNTASATVSGINIDKTPPTVTPTVTGTLGNNGWYTSNVTVSWSVSDALSGMDSSTDCGTTSITADTLGVTLTCSATDKAGNSTSQSVTIKRDATNPTISGSRAPAANAYGWNNTDVTATFTCGDNLSGVASCGPTPQTLSSEGAGQSASGTAQDSAGNTASATVSGINIDKTPPSVSVTGFTDGQIFYTGGGPLPTVRCSATDSLSGVVEPVGSATVVVALNGNGVGSASYQCSATDKAGNVGSDTKKYYVHYGGVSGILQPIKPDNTSLFNRGKAVPVKFTLSGDEYTGFNTAYWKLQAVPVSCTSFDALEADLADVGSVTPYTVFRYDAAADQYIYNADFRDKAAGTCWRVRVTLDDGSTMMESATFKLQK